MSWPEYLSSFDELNYEGNDIYTNNTPQDDDTENTYFISDTSEFETNMVFNSRQQLIDWVQNTGHKLGYVIVTKRSIANYSIYFQCDRGGTYRTKKLSTKNTGTKKIDCPFALKGKYSSRDDCWSLKAICEIHNHELALYLQGDPYPRRLSENETRLVEDLIRQNVKPKDILSTLKKQNVENLSILPTIYNAQQKFKRRENGGKTKMQVAMSFLDENDYIYYSRSDTSTNELQGLFFTHQRSLEMWLAFPHVMLMDATYNTIRYDMPLLEIVGVAPTNQTFCIAFVFMHKETESGYTWALECLKSTMDRCMYPRVIVTDRDLACMKACNNVFPKAKGLLCRWHINSSIKRKYKTLLLRHCWTPFYKGWKKLVESETEETYIANLSQVEKILVNYKEVIAYLKKTWLTPYKEKFVSVWVDKFLHFGNYTTNRVESQHAKLKEYLDSAQSDLATALPRIHDVVHSQFYAIISSIGQSMVIARHRFTDHLFFEKLVGHVSIHALEKIFKEFEQINSLEICGCQMRTSYRLPCAHEQAVYLRNGNPIPLDAVHIFWKKIDLHPYISPEDGDLDIDAEVQTSNTQPKKQSRFSKFSWLRKAKDIFSPSTSSLREPTSQKNKASTGRPSLSTQRPPIPPTQDPQTQYPRRHSFATSMPDYRGSDQFGLNQEPERHRTFFATSMPDYRGSNQFDLNQEPERHRTFSFREPSKFYSNQFMSEIPNEFHPYVTNIEDVAGDGNCGFRAVAVSLAYNQNYWPQIRLQLRTELLTHWRMYEMIFGNYIHTLNHSLSFTGTGSALNEYWMIMLDTGFLIANMYSVIVNFLNNAGSSTCFPLWIGLQDISNHRSIVIALVHNVHYVKVDLQESHQMPQVCPLWRGYRSERAAGWEIMYSARLNAYISRNAPRNNRNSQIDVPDN